METIAAACIPTGSFAESTIFHCCSPYIHTSVVSVYAPPVVKPPETTNTFKKCFFAPTGAQEVTLCVCLCVVCVSMCDICEFFTEYLHSLRVIFEGSLNSLRAVLEQS